MVSVQTPPTSNTGAQITAPSENRCIIDWFAFTFKNISDPYEVADLMRLPRGLFTDLERGGMGYKKKIQFNNISIYHDGSDGMGCHVEMSGQGCRDYEAHKQDWRTLISLIELQKGHMTRLDIAIDTVDDSLKLTHINSAIRSGHLRTKFTKYRKNESGTITAHGITGKSRSVYFGSGTSRVQFRIYDKAAQLGLDLKWLRFELQLRDDRADVAAGLIVRRENLGHIAAGVINQYLSFINKDDSNKSRCSLKSWWSSWLSTSEKLKLTTAKAIKVLSEVQDYIKKQYAPTLAMLKKGLGVSTFYDFIKETIDEGFNRMTRKHDDIILCSRLATELPF